MAPMKRTAFAACALFATTALFAQQTQPPRLTLDYPAIARRLVTQLALTPGERVMSIAQPGVFADLIPYIRYEVMKAGGIDLGVVQALREPWSDTFELPIVVRGAQESRAHYKDMFRNVDAAIMLPGATSSHPAYLAMQDWLKEDLTERRGRRTIHFHWIENGSAYEIPGQPLPRRFTMDALYQRALLDTDYAALAKRLREFGERMRGRLVHLTSPSGTDLRFRIGDRPVNYQDGDASKAHAAAGRVLIDKEIELPAGAVRVAP